MSEDMQGRKICECDNQIGENCEQCYSSAGTKPCLSRYCGDCGIEGCSVRVVKKVSLCKNCNQTFDLCPCNHNLTSVLGCTLNSNCYECCYAKECEAKNA